MTEIRPGDLVDTPQGYGTVQELVRPDARATEDQCGEHLPGPLAPVSGYRVSLYRGGEAVVALDEARRLSHAGTCDP